MQKLNSGWLYWKELKCGVGTVLVSKGGDTTEYAFSSVLVSTNSYLTLKFLLSVSRRIDLKKSRFNLKDTSQKHKLVWPKDCFLQAVQQLSSGL